jgi:hypothetical protein
MIKIKAARRKLTAESSAEFLSAWDWWIRVAGFGELALAIVTLIFVRTRAAMTNAIRVEDFPHEIDAGVVEKCLPARRENFAKKKERAKNHASFDPEGLKRLREALRDTSFRLPGLSFKSYVRGDAVWILMMKANQGPQETVASAKAELLILDDALKMPADRFRERLERFLRQKGLEI